MVTTECSFLKFYKLHVWPVLFLCLAAFWGCNTNETEPKIIKLEEQEAAKRAAEIEETTSAELADGLELNLWASESLVGDIVGMNIDNKGRAFVTVTNRSGGSEFDIRGFRHWMIESISWDKVEDRKAFLRRELAPERSDSNTWLPDRNGDGLHDWRDLTVEKEEVYIIEDSTGDGIADRSQLYISGFNSEETDVAGAIYYFNDELFLGVGPDLWRLKDTDGDGMADQKESISYGYAIHIGFSGHGMSGLTMGPDGKIYWGIGDIGFNVVDQDGKRWYYPNQGGILRSNPDGSDFEVFAAGVRNTHEFVFDKYGNLITVDNDGDHAGEHERLVYLINGSDSGWRTNWQFGKYVDPKNNDYKVWMDEEYFRPRFEGQAAHILPPLAPYHSGPAGMSYNPGTALSEEWADHFFVAEFVGAPARSAIHAFTLEPKGASFELLETQPIMKGVLATGMDIGPDGALYFTDWIDGWGTKDKGRIWKLDTPSTKGSDIRKETERILAEGFSSKTGDDLFDLLRHPDMRVRTGAQFELVRQNATEALMAAISQTDHQLMRVHGIWGMGQLARGKAELAEPLTEYLRDSDPEIRTQVAKILGDIRYKPAAESIIPLLKDEYARARMFAAEALGRMEHQPAVQPIVDMLEANNDEDVYLRHAGAISLARIGDAETVTALHDHPSAAVRVAAVVALKRMEDPGVAEFLSDSDEFVVTNAARAINDDHQIKEALPDLARMLDQNRFMNEPLLRRAINANLYSGTPENAKRLAEFAVREGVPEEMRIEALATLSVWDNPSTLDRVTGRYRGEIERNPAVARQAIEPVISQLLTEGSTPVKIAAIETVGKLSYAEAYPALISMLKEDAATGVRIAVLRALQEGSYSQIEEAVGIALEDPQQNVRMTALSMIPALDIAEERKVDLLASVLGSKSVVEQQSALEALGALQSEAAYKILNRQLDKFADDELMAEVQLELITAVERSSSEELKSRLADYRSARENENSVEAYRESLWGGSAERGRRIFYRHEGAQCTRCHAIDGRGGDVGPDLTHIARILSRDQLLESLVDPGARIAPGYGVVTATLNSGEKVQGIVVEESEKWFTIRTGEGEHITMQKSDVAERIDPPSAMPPVGEVLTRSELRDLVEFLNTLE